MSKSKRLQFNFKRLAAGAFLIFSFNMLSVQALDEPLVNQTSIVSGAEELKSESSSAQNESVNKLKEESNKDSRRYALSTEILQNRMKEMGLKVAE